MFRVDTISHIRKAINPNLEDLNSESLKNPFQAGFSSREAKSTSLRFRIMGKATRMGPEGNHLIRLRE